MQAADKKRTLEVPTTYTARYSKELSSERCQDAFLLRCIKDWIRLILIAML